MKKKISIIIPAVICGLAVIFGALYFIPFKSAMDKEVTAVDVQDGVETTRKVRFQGTYTNYLFKNDYFEGIVIIEDYEPSEMTDPQVSTVGFEVVPTGVTMTYAWMKEPGVPTLKMGSMICAEPYFDKFTIFCTMDPADLDGDPETSYESSSDYYSLTDHILSYPAQNAQEAEEQAQSYIEKMGQVWGYSLGSNEESWDV